MSNRSPIRVKVWGEYACFTRPEMKVERVSYDVITPSAARGILEAIYWKPQVRWVVERLHVLKPIRFTNLRRNEVSAKVVVDGRDGARQAMNAGVGAIGIGIDEIGPDGKLKYRQQRAATILRDVAYVIEARFELVDDSEPVAKHYNMFKRRADQGQYFHHPYLGTREFPCDFAWVEGDIPKSEIEGDRDLGYILHDIVYTPAVGKEFNVIESHAGRTLHASARFFRATMTDGMIRVPALAAGEVAL